MKLHFTRESLLIVFASVGASLGYGRDPEYPNALCCPKASKEDYFKLRPLYDDQDAIERISCDISRADFDELYSIPQKPVILVGCDDAWPAKYKWTIPQLAKRFDRDTEWRALIGDELDMANDNTKNTKWGTIADAMRNNITFNIFDNIDDPHQQELTRDYDWPLFAKNTDVHNYFEQIPGEAYGSMRWFGAGSPFTGTDTHYDPFTTDAWNTVVQGEKWWFLMPFEADSHFALHCSPSCSTPYPDSLDKYIGILTSESPQVKEFKDKYLSHSFQKAGETLYLPSGYLHSVLNTDFTIFITGNYLNQVNLGVDGVWDQIVKKSLPEELRYFYCNVMSEEERQKFEEPIVCDQSLGNLISHQVARYGNLDALIDLSKTDYDSLHAPDKNGWTPLHEAAAFDSITSLRFLLDNEADIDATTNHGETPLDIVRKMFGEDHNTYVFLSNYENTEEYTPHVAAAYGDLPFLIRMFYEDPERLYEKNEIGWSPIHEAAYNGHGAVLEFLLENESDPNSQTDNGESTFDIIRHEFGEEHDLFRLLLSFGEDSAEL